MPRSYGSRRASTWAVAQAPKPRARVVRLGRPANDNGRTPSFLRMLVTTVATAVALYALYRWLDF
jgi:hypothetical protein